METDTLRRSACPVDCPGCDAAAAADQPAGLSGWRMVLCSAVVFLLPLAAAIAGAALAGPVRIQQVGGVLLGLSLGIGMASLLFRMIRGSDSSP
jgi:hypothetical protein